MLFYWLVVDERGRYNRINDVNQGGVIKR